MRFTSLLAALAVNFFMYDSLVNAQTVFESIKLSVPHGSSSYGLGLSVYNLAPDKWMPDELSYQVAEVNRVLRQCDVQVEQVRFITLEDADLPYDFPDFVSLNRSLLTSRYLSHAVVNLFFVDSFYGDLGRQSRSGVALNETWVRQAESQYRGISYARGSAWLTRVIVSERYRELLDPRYSPAAHELAHILLDANHISNPRVANVLSANNLRNDVFTEAQCARIRRSPYVYSRQPMLERRSFRY